MEQFQKFREVPYFPPHTKNPSEVLTGTWNFPDIASPFIVPHGKKSAFKWNHPLEEVTKMYATVLLIDSISYPAVVFLWKL